MYSIKEFTTYTFYNYNRIKSGQILNIDFVDVSS